MKERTKKTAKRIAVGAAGVAASAGLLVHTAIADTKVLLTPTQTDTADASHVCTVSGTEHRTYRIETEKEVPLTLRERLCLRVQALPLPVRTLILLPLWGIGEVLTALLTALWNSPIGRFLLHYALEIAVLIGVFALIWKLLFPNVPVKKLFSRKYLPWIIAGALLITVADTLLGIYWEQWKIWRIVIFAVVGFVVLLLLYHRILDKLPLPKRRKQTVELFVE